MSDQKSETQQRDALLLKLLKTPPQPRPKRERGEKPPTKRGEALAAKACKDLIAFLAVAKNVIEAAEAFRDCVKCGRSVIVCHLDRDATVIAGKPVFRFELNETLMGYLTASRTRQVVDAGVPSAVT